jgi:hypothetical protein
MSDSAIQEDIKECDRMIAEIEAALLDDTDRLADSVDHPIDNLGSPKSADYSSDVEIKDDIVAETPKGCYTCQYHPDFMC